MQGLRQASLNDVALLSGEAMSAQTPLSKDTTSGADRIVIHGQDFTEEMAACDADDARIFRAGTQHQRRAGQSILPRHVWLAAMGMTGQQRTDFWCEFSSNTEPKL